LVADVVGVVVAVVMVPLRSFFSTGYWVPWCVVRPDAADCRG
jgi:hypothetical protein